MPVCVYHARMPRRMSCALTIDAVRARTKTVTRRRADTWATLHAGDHLVLVEKGQGLTLGSKQVVLAEVEVTDVRVERLSAMESAEVAAEGFPGMSRLDFMLMWAQSHGYTNALDHGPLHSLLCRRIEWAYVD